MLDSYKITLDKKVRELEEKVFVFFDDEYHRTKKSKDLKMKIEFYEWISRKKAGVRQTWTASIKKISH